MPVGPNRALEQALPAYVSLQATHEAKQNQPGASVLKRVTRWLKRECAPIDPKTVRTHLADTYGVTFNDRLTAEKQNRLARGWLTQSQASKLERALKANAARNASEMVIDASIPKTGEIRKASWAQTCLLEVFNAERAKSNQPAYDALSPAACDLFLTPDLGIRLREQFLADTSLFSGVGPAMKGAPELSLDTTLMQRRSERIAAANRLGELTRQALASRLEIVKLAFAHKLSPELGRQLAEICHPFGPLGHGELRQRIQGAREVFRFIDDLKLPKEEADALKFDVLKTGAVPAQLQAKGAPQLSALHFYASPQERTVTFDVPDRPASSKSSGSTKSSESAISSKSAKSARSASISSSNASQTSASDASEATGSETTSSEATGSDTHSSEETHSGEQAGSASSAAEPALAHQKLEALADRYFAPHSLFPDTSPQTQQILYALFHHAVSREFKDVNAAPADRLAAIAKEAVDRIRAQQHGHLLPNLRAYAGEFLSRSPADKKGFLPHVIGQTLSAIQNGTVETSIGNVIVQLLNTIQRVWDVEIPPGRQTIRSDHRLGSLLDEYAHFFSGPGIKTQQEQRLIQAALAEFGNTIKLLEDRMAMHNIVFEYSQSK